MTECVEEQQTKHYRGKWCGFGPVRSGEQLLFAVFEQTKYQGSRLAGDSFKELKNTNESVVRCSYVTRSLFESRIVQPGEAARGALVGVAVADVSRIRTLRTDIKLNATTVKVRSICVIDRVDEGDIDAHATMGFAELKEGVSQAQIGTIRMNIRMDLAGVFSEIGPPDGQRWPWRLGVALKRAASIARVLFATLKHSRLLGRALS
jgi:hypothetical protein